MAKARRQTQKIAPQARGGAGTAGRRGAGGDPRRRAGIAVAIGLAVLIAVTYGNAVNAGLLVDSATLVRQDPRIREVTSDNLANILTKPYWWPSFESDLYRPITTLTYLVNYAVLDHGVRPAGYHVINLILHWLNACLVVALVRRLSGGAAWALLAGAIFAVHPVNTEAVTNIAGRADLLAALSMLLAAWCYARACATRGAAGALWIAGVGANAFWGVFAKESAVMIVAFLLLFDWLWRWPALDGPTAGARLRQAASKCAPVYLAVAPALALMFLVRRQVGLASSEFTQVFVDNPITGAAGWWQGRMTAIGVVGRELGLLVFPRTLSSDYSYNQIPLFGTASDAAGLWVPWISLVAVVSLIGIAIFLRRRLPMFTWGVGVFFLTLLPVSNLVITIGSIMAERFLYAPSIGFCAVAAMGVWWLGMKAGNLVRSDAIGRWAPLAMSVVLLGLLGARTYARNADWQDERSLWASARAAAPASFKVYKGSATAAWANGEGTGERDLDEAIALAERGRSILESSALPLSQQDNTLWLDLGQYYRMKGELLAGRNQLDEGRRYFSKAVDVLLKAREVDRWINETSRRRMQDRGVAAGEIPDTGNFNVYVQLGASYLDLYQWADAETAARQAMRLQPLEPSGYRLAALARLNAGNAREATVLYLAVVTLQPSNTSSWNELAFCFERMGVTPAPIRQVGHVQALDRSNPAVQPLLAEATAIVVNQLEQARQFDDARRFRQDVAERLRQP